MTAALPVPFSLYWAWRRDGVRSYPVIVLTRPEGDRVLVLEKASGEMGRSAIDIRRLTGARRWIPLAALAGVDGAQPPLAGLDV